MGLACTSCGTALSVKKDNTEVAGYTLKNKKEQFQQKILHKKVKTVIVQP
jgi:predicted metal-binding protein